MKNIIPCRIGEYWQGQGGIRIAECPGQNGEPDYHLILPIHPDAELGELEYGSYGQKIDGAYSEWDGLANTRALVEAGNHPAAERCAALTIEGHSDLYLPAKRELALVQVIAPEHCKKDWHWSSTQSSADDAFVQGFYDGTQYCSSKGSSNCRVRPVRRLPIQ